MTANVTFIKYDIFAPYRGGVFFAGPPIGNDATTVLLLHMDGADASTTISDSSPKAHGNATAVGNAQLDTAQFKFGTASLLNDGTGDSITYADSTDWHMWGANATIDLWVRWNALPTTGNQANFAIQYDGANGWLFKLHNAAGTYTIELNGFGTVEGGFKATITAPSLNTWYHYAVERHGSTTNFYVGGVKQTTVETTAWGSVADVAAVLAISSNAAGDAGSSINGWVDEFRISKGIARYAGVNFTVPNHAYI